MTTSSASMMNTTTSDCTTTGGRYIEDRRDRKINNLENEVYRLKGEVENRDIKITNLINELNRNDAEKSLFIEAAMHHLDIETLKETVEKISRARRNTIDFEKILGEEITELVNFKFK